MPEPTHDEQAEVLRPPTDDDLATFLVLDKAFTAELQVAGLPGLPGYSAEWFKRRLSRGRQRFLNWRGVTLAKGGQVIGGAIWSLETAILRSDRGDGKEQPPTAETHGPRRKRRRTSKRRRRTKYVELFWIFVASAHRGQGYGRLLEEEVIRRARADWKEVEQCRLHVLATNSKALQFYSRLGYCEVSTKVDYPTQGWTAKRMARSLCDT